MNNEEIKSNKENKSISTVRFFDYTEDDLRNFSTLDIYSIIMFDILDSLYLVVLWSFLIIATVGLFYI